MVYFLYSWTLSDSFDVDIGSVLDWGYADVNFGQIDFEELVGHSDVTHYLVGSGLYRLVLCGEICS